MKYSDEQCLDVIRFCISYLYEKFSNERGLFRSTVAKPDVRLLQSQIVQNGQGKFWEELDPHLVAEVLHSTLKDLRTPLLHEVYQEMMNTELVEDKFEANKAAVLKWIVEIPPHKLSIVKSYFQLLSRLVTLEDNDASLTQLAYTVAPAICRPTSSAYMSIRHMEDLKRLRPVIMFLMGNFDEVFADVQTTTTLPVPSHAASEPPVEDKMLAEMMTSAMVIDVASKPQLSTFSDEAECSVSPSPFVRPPGLLVSIPTLNIPGAVPAISTESNTSMELDSSDESSRRSSIPNNSYTEMEWRVLHALVCGKMASYLDVEDNDVAAYVAKEASTDNYCSVMQAWTAKQVAAAVNPSPMKADISNVPVSPSSSIGSMNRAVAMQKSSSRRTYRRKMVADCKALRSQIHDFEHEFSQKHSRLPKPMERGIMNAAYVKYRELKRDIRDNAAADVQRVWRGTRARMAIKGIHRSLSKSGDDSTGKHRHESKGLHGSTTSSSKSLELNSAFKRYRELRDSKRDLKKKLKKFDEDFLAQYGRNPKKSDKEVIRPMYQKYHEIKNSLEDLRLRLQQSSRDVIPEDLVDEIMSPTGAHHDGTKRSFGGDSDFEGTDDLERSGSKSKVGKAAESKQAAPSVVASADAEQAKVLDTMESLQLEKKNLHAYLKVYERDFNRTHGRPVTKNEDILPVANEYQRYKELKMLIKEIKAQSP